MRAVRKFLDVKTYVSLVAPIPLVGDSIFGGIMDNGLETNWTWRKGKKCSRHTQRIFKSRKTESRGHCNPAGGVIVSEVPGNVLGDKVIITILLDRRG